MVLGSFSWFLSFPFIQRWSKDAIESFFLHKEKARNRSASKLSVCTRNQRCPTVCYMARTLRYRLARDSCDIARYFGIAGFPKNPGFHGVQYTWLFLNWNSFRIRFGIPSLDTILVVFSCLFHLPALIRTGKGKYLWNNGHYYEGTARHSTAGGLESHWIPGSLGFGFSGDWEADQMHGEGVWGQGRSFHQTRFRLQSFHVISIVVTDTWATKKLNHVKSLCAGPDSPRSDQKESNRYCPFSYFCNILILYHWDLRMAHRGQIRGNLPKQPEARWTS